MIAEHRPGHAEALQKCGGWRGLVYGAQAKYALDAVLLEALQVVVVGGGRTESHLSTDQPVQVQGLSQCSGSIVVVVVFDNLVKAQNIHEAGKRLSHSVDRVGNLG